MSLFTCPVCRGKLALSGKSYVCDSGHCFDISKEGYVHLVLPNRMKSKEPGDSREMVRSRSCFLEKGYYAPLLENLCSTLNYYSDEKNSLLDCGCGEGYYTNAIYSYLSGKGKNIEMAAFDISRTSVVHASKHGTGTEYAVASVFDIPAENERFDILLNIFSPMCENEFARVLREDGILVYVVPGPRHLWQMKEKIYDMPYENSESDIDYAGFTHEKTVKVRYVIEMDNPDDIRSLFTMTPYYWKTSAKGTEKLMSLNELSTEVSFDIHIYRKK